jgi:short-chain 2-methylacyl-CoA dehydrogenase
MPVTIFTEEEALVQESTRSWARSVLLPKVRDMDNAGELDPKVLNALFEQGLMGLEIPEEMGGSGLNFTSAVLVVEELSRIDPSVSILVDIHNTLIVNALRFWGSSELRQLWLPRLATDTVSSFCLSEAGSGSDAFSMRTTATLEKAHGEEGGFYVINGEKLWISSAKQAGVFLVFANADVTRGYKGITAFVVDANTEGITVGKPEPKLGLKASSTCPVVFDHVVVPESSVLGEVGKGYKYCIEILNEGRIGIAAQQLGIAKGCLDVVLPYINDRVQFGKPLMDFQSVQHQYAQAATDIYAAECMIYNACRLKEAGRSIVKEASMCKYYASQVAERVASRSIELLGGVGFTQHLLVEKMYRDCKVGAIYEGTSNIQLQTIAKLIQSEYNRDR